jgi:hypothetical protein
MGSPFQFSFTTEEVATPTGDIITSPPGYIKQNPPSDINQPPDLSCWKATASNMLAGAGYGDGSTLEQRAADIYSELVREMDNGAGHIKTALQRYICALSGASTSNSYKVFNAHGHTDPFHWNNDQAPSFIGSALRQCDFVGLTLGRYRGRIYAHETWGHTVTAWGDEQDDGPLTVDPSLVKITDSNPAIPNNPYGYSIYNYELRAHDTIVVDGPYGTPLGVAETPDVGEAHYLGNYDAYGSTRWFLVNAVTLEKGNVPCPHSGALAISAHQIDPSPPTKPEVIHSRTAVSRGTTLHYRSIRLKMPTPDIKNRLPDASIKLLTQSKPNAAMIPNVTGGYVVGAFRVAKKKSSGRWEQLGEYRFFQQYHYDQDPERHVFYLRGPSGFSVSHIRFGHSYGYLSEKSLLNFDSWLTDLAARRILGGTTIKIKIDWPGKLPYPQGAGILPNP